LRKIRRNTRQQSRSRGYRDPSSHNQRSSKIFTQGAIDINTNVGEGFGPWRTEGEQDMLPFVTSANIACGAHAGDPVIMERALEEVRYYGLSLGAHIGYPDIQGFGRREIHLSTSELRSSILYQLGALSGVAKTLGFDITQVRPHGFMYRQMAQDIRVTTAVAKAISEFDPWLVLIGPAGNNLLAAGDKAGIRVAMEAWVDRTYDSSGNLLPHTHSRAIIKNQKEILNQAANLIANGTVKTVDGSIIKLEFQTIHLHANIPQAKQVAETIRQMIPDARALVSMPFEVDDPESLERLYVD
jgi:UPF0271 protein